MGTPPSKLLRRTIKTSPNLTALVGKIAPLKEITAEVVEQAAAENTTHLFGFPIGTGRHSNKL